MNRNRSPAAILVVKYGMTTLLSYPLESQRSKPLDYIPALRGGSLVILQW